MLQSIRSQSQTDTTKLLNNHKYTELASVEKSPQLLVRGSELPIFEKYDRFIPAELLRSAYAVDKLNVQEAHARAKQLLDEYIYRHNA